MANIAGLRSRLRMLRTSVCPPPKQEIWMPLGVNIREPREGEKEGFFYFADEEAEATYDRCEKLGIKPNVYIVSDEWDPDMDGTELAEGGVNNEQS